MKKIICLIVTAFRRVANHISTFATGKDIVKVISDGYSHIDPVYRRSFWIIFWALCFAFGLHAIWMIWGNHDWSAMKDNHGWFSLAKEGRYMLYSVRRALLSGGVSLHLICDIITFVTLAINAILLCQYWHLEKRVSYFVLCGLVLTAQPFTLGMMYFVFMTPEVFIGVTCALVALLLSEKIALMEGSAIKKMIYSFIAIVLINFAPAMYPVLINTIVVAFVGRLLIYAFEWDGSWRQLKSIIKPLMISAANIVLGIALYKMMITFGFSVRRNYNTDTLPLEQVPERLVVLFKQCFHQLYEYDLPFLSQWILWMFLGFTIILALHICFTGSLRQKIIRLLLLFGSLFATQTVMTIAITHVINARVELFGLVVFETLVMVLVITRFRKLRNLWVIAGALVVCSSVLNDQDCLRVWKLGFDAERMLWNRVLTRLEAQKEFSPARKYDVVQIGSPISMRPRYYNRADAQTPSDDMMLHDHFMLRVSYDFFSPWSAHQFYYPRHFRRKGFAGGGGYIARLKRLYQAGVLQRAEVWPRPNGLIVWKDIILFVTDGKELEDYKKQFAREEGRK